MKFFRDVAAVAVGYLLGVVLVQLTNILLYMVGV